MLQEWTVLQTVAATRAPISVLDVKQNLNLPTDYTQHDAKLNDLILAATDRFENDTSRICMAQTFELLIDELAPYGQGPIDLYKRPIQSVESITYLDADGESHTVDDTQYVLSKARRQVFLAAGGAWPETMRQRESVAITFVAGVTEQSQVPRLYRQAISLAVGAWFTDPTDESQRNQWENAYESIVRRFIHEKEI